MPVVPTVSGRQVQSRGVQSAGLQTFSQPGIGDAFVRAGTEAIDVLVRQNSVPISLWLRRHLLTSVR